MEEKCINAFYFLTGPGYYGVMESQNVRDMRKVPSVPVFSPRWIERKALTSVLESAGAKKITLVNGPAGYGKTSLVVSWLKEYGRKAGWYSAGTEEAGSAGFFTALADALAAVSEYRADVFHDYAETLPAPSADELASSFLSLFENLDDSSGKPLILVIDDYHLVTGINIHRAVHFMVSHMPDGLRIIFISRGDLPFPVSKFRLADEICEIRGNQLLLSADETGLLAEKTFSMNLDREQTAKLHRLSEGWMTAACLALISRRSGSAADFPDSLPERNRYVGEYLVEEVLEHLDPEISSQLLVLSVPESISVSMASFLLGEDMGQSVLNTLSEKNCFLVPVEGPEEVFRFHPFFRQFLLQKLKEEGSGIFKETAGKLSLWYERKGMTDRALEYAIKGGEVLRTEDLIEKAASEYQDDRRLFLYDQLLNEAGFDHSSFPELELHRARTCLHRGEMNRVFLHLKKVEEGLASGNGRDPERIRAAMGMMKATIALFSGAIGSLKSECRRVISCMDGRNDRLTAMAMSYLAVGALYSEESDLLETSRNFENAAAEAEKAGDEIMALNADFQRGVVLRQAGDLKKAERLNRIRLDRIKKNGYPASGIEGVSLCETALITCEKGEEDSAAGMAEEGLDLARESCSLTVRWWAICDMVRILLYLEDLEAAGGYLEELKTTAAENTIPPWFRSLAIELDLRKLVQERKAVEDDFTALMPEISGAPDYSFSGLRLQYIRFLILSGRFHEAAELAGPILTWASGFGRMDTALEAGILLAVSLEKTGLPEWEEPLLKVLRSGERGGYFRIFTSEREFLGDLLMRLQVSGQGQEVSPEYLNSIIKAMKIGMDDGSFPVRGDKKDGSRRGVFELSEREREVLNMLARGCSNLEISEGLFISLNTVKTHLKNINAKLNAENRTRAVALGREAGLC